MTKVKKIVGIYHSKDLDGWACGLIMKYAIPDIYLVGYDYGQTIPDCVFDADEIIIADVSFPIAIYHNLLLQGCKIQIIDHHQSSINEIIEHNLMYTYSNLKVRFDVYNSASELCWKELVGSYVPWWLEYVGINDMKSRQDQQLNRYKNEIRPFCVAVSSTIYNYITYNHIPRIASEPLENVTPRSFLTYIFPSIDNRSSYIKTGTSMLLHQEFINKQIATTASFESQISGYHAICLNSPFKGVEVFQSIYDKTVHDIMFLYHFDGKEYDCSVYSHKLEVDASKIAARFGGGGHNYAAGFKVTNIDVVFGT